MTPGEVFELAQRLARIEGRLTGIEDKLGEVHDEVRATNGRVTRLETTAAITADRETRQHEQRQGRRWRTNLVAGTAVALASSSMAVELLHILGA